MDERTQRVAAYVVITRDDQILLCRLSPRVTDRELWHLPGGGVDHGEHPAEAVVREVWEETGLSVAVRKEVRVDSAQVGDSGERHALRLFYDGALVDPDDPANDHPRVQEVDGSTMDARWFPIADVRAGSVPLTAAAQFALDGLGVPKVQRLSAYAVVRRGEELLLTRVSQRGHQPGAWTLPGGGVDHGEHPAAAVRREVREETGLACEVGSLLGVHDVHLTGRAPNGRIEDFHGVQLLFAATVGDGEPVVHDAGGTTDAAAWVPIARIRSGEVEVLDVVRAALDLA